VQAYQIKKKIKDIVFNGSTPNTEKASQRYVVDNRELYLVFGIPDPGV